MKKKNAKEKNTRNPKPVQTNTIGGNLKISKTEIGGKDAVRHFGKFGTLETVKF